MKKIVLKLNKEDIEVVESNHPELLKSNRVQRCIYDVLIDRCITEGYLVEFLPNESEKEKLNKEIDLFLVNHSKREHFREVLKDVSEKYFKEIDLSKATFIESEQKPPIINWNHQGSDQPIIVKEDTSTYVVFEEGLEIAIIKLLRESLIQDEIESVDFLDSTKGESVRAVVKLKSKSQNDVWNRVNDAVIEFLSKTPEYGPTDLCLNVKDGKDLEAYYRNLSVIYPEGLGQFVNFNTITVQGYDLKVTSNLPGKSFVKSLEAQKNSHEIIVYF